MQGTLGFWATNSFTFTTYSFMLTHVVFILELIKSIILHVAPPDKRILRYTLEFANLYLGIDVVKS